MASCLSIYVNVYIYGRIWLEPVMFVNICDSVKGSSEVEIKGGTNTKFK